MQAKRPLVSGKQRDDRFKFRVQRGRQIGPRLKEVLEIGRGEHQHLPSAIAAQEIVTLTGPSHFDPARKVFSLLLRFLGEEIVGDANGHFPALMQLLDDGVILRVVLRAAASINDTREPETVELAHEVASGIHLMLRRELRPLGERRVKNRGVGTRDEQAGRVALGVLLDFATGRIWCVFCITAGAEGCLI